ncbi:aldehyde dehydrogenase family protein [Novosphingobium sp. HR1a]|uniref:aldehyde dehydrogenase family protein n=1 Tax=Novosphingobium sp. HR1a TaxID=1395637 RepID=UPI0035C6F4AB
MTAGRGKLPGEPKSELTYAYSFRAWFADEALHINGDVLTPQKSNRRILVRKQPVGGMAVFTPRTFPFAMVIKWLVERPVLAKSAYYGHGSEWQDCPCAVPRRRFPVGENPTRQNAPAGSNRGRHGGDEMSEAPG